MTDKKLYKEIDHEQSWENFVIERIVLKDLSFERPMGPEVFTSELQPKYSIRLELGSNRVASKLWEFLISATVTAKLGDKVAYLAEATQAGVFRIVADLDKEALRRLAAVEAPRLVFPYLRETVDNAIAKGGFPPIGLQPPNFASWYEDVKQPKGTATDES